MNKHKFFVVKYSDETNTYKLDNGILTNISLLNTRIGWDMTIEKCIDFFTIALHGEILHILDNIDIDIYTHFRKLF